MREPTPLFTLLGIACYPYGAALALGLLLAALMAMASFRKAFGAAEDGLRFSLWALPLGFVGARLGYCAVKASFIAVDFGPAFLYHFGLGGYSMAGAFVGVLAAAALSHIHVYIRCRRSVAKGDGLPVRPQRPVRARVLLDYALMLLVWLTCFGSALAWIGGNSLPVERADREELRREPVVLAEDLKIRDGRTSSLSVQEGASLLVSWRRTCEVLRKDGALTGQVRCEVYRCRSVRIARLLAGALYREEREGRPRRLLERHGALELTEAALGFDQAWTGDGPDGSCLLLRQGTTVAVLEAPAELTGADTLEKLWTRLQLEGKAA